MQCYVSITLYYVNIAGGKLELSGHFNVIINYCILFIEIKHNNIIKYTRTIKLAEA